MPARQTPINGTYALPAASLDGANVWLLEYIASAAGMSFSYEVAFVPDSIFYANRTVQLDYVLNVLGYDCMLDSTVLRGEELAYARFLVPNERFGLSVVTGLSAPSDYPVIAMLFAWTAPFTWQVWCVVLAALIFGGIAMFFFEAGEDMSEDYGEAGVFWPLRIVRGCYRAFCNFTCVGGFSPNTAAGQAFNVTFSMSMLLLQAAYTANLAAYFTRTEPPSSPIATMADFGGMQLPACVLNDPYVYTLLRSAFPLTQFVQLNSSLVSDLVDAVESGLCAGGIAPDLQLRYTLGLQDPLGAHCSLQLTGGLLSQNYYAIPFNRNTVSATVLEAMGAIAANAFAYGDYAVGASMASFPQDRPACIAYAIGQSGNALTPLHLRHVSGIFFLMVFGFGSALVLGILFTHRRRIKALWSRLCGGTGDVEEEEEEDAVQDGTSAEEVKATHRATTGKEEQEKEEDEVDPLDPADVYYQKIQASFRQEQLNAARDAADPARAAARFAARRDCRPCSGVAPLEVLAASIARELANALAVSEMSYTALAAAVANRGHLVATVQLFDSHGRTWCAEPVATLPLSRPSDWQFLFARMSTEQQAVFTRAARAMAGLLPPPGGTVRREGMLNLAPPELVKESKESKQQRKSSQSDDAALQLQSVVVQRSPAEPASPPSPPAQPGSPASPASPMSISSASSSASPSSASYSSSPPQPPLPPMFAPLVPLQRSRSTGRGGGLLRRDSQKEGNDGK